MVITAAQGEVLLGPDDLSARLQPAAGQIACFGERKNNVDNRKRGEASSR
jgi:hypothetical protein